jgi:hypothetical protein
MIRLIASRSFDHSVPFEQQEDGLIRSLSGTAFSASFFSYPDGLSGLAVEPVPGGSVIP